MFSKHFTKNTPSVQLVYLIFWFICLLKDKKDNINLDLISNDRENRYLLHVRLNFYLYLNQFIKKLDFTIFQILRIYLTYLF